MSKSIVDNRGTYFSGNATGLGQLRFYEGDTDVLATVYYDRELTTEAPNPLPINLDGVIEQVWTNQLLKVYQDFYVGGIYVPVKEWFFDGTESSAVASSIASVNTIAELKALTPVNGDVVFVKGYYSAGDCPARFVKFNSTSLDTPNDGTRIRPNGYGSGAFEDNSQGDINAKLFGVHNPSTSANGYLASAISWCNGTGQKLVFSEGIYKLGIGSASPNCPVKIENGAYFDCSDVFTLSPAKEWDLPEDTAIGNANFIIDLSGSKHFLLSGCSLGWWGGNNITAFFRACSYAGISGIRVVSAISLVYTGVGVGVTTKRIAFADAGKITFSTTGGNWTVTADVIDALGAKSGLLFEASTGRASDYVRINSVAKSSWFDDAEVGANIADVGYSFLEVDSTVTCLDVVHLGNVAGLGGKIIANSVAITLNVVSGERFLECAGVGSFIGCYDAHKYFLDSATKIQGFIKSCTDNLEICDFQGISTSGNIAISNATISNMNHLSNISSSTSLTIYSSRVVGNITAVLFKAISSVFANITADYGSMLSCTFASASIGKSGQDVDFVAKSCITSGGITLVSALADKMKRLAIDNCTYTGSGTPLVVTNCLCNSYSTGGYIQVKDNTPCVKDEDYPITGSWAQSFINVILNLSVPSGSEAKTATKNMSTTYAIRFPNLAVSGSGLFLNCSNLSVNTEDLRFEAIANDGKNGNLLVKCNVDFSTSGRPVLVSGNIY